MIYKSADEVWKAAKEAFKDIKRTSYEKKMMKPKPKPKNTWLVS